MTRKILPEALSLLGLALNILLFQRLIGNFCNLTNFLILIIFIN